MFEKDLNPEPFFSIKSKKIAYYKGFTIMSDPNLHEQVLTIIKKNIPKGSKIFIFGSGEGALDQRLKDLGFEIFSSDIDSKNFKADTEFIKADFNNCSDMQDIVNKKKGVFDLVVSLEIIEHIENLDLYFSTISKVLKRNGKVIVSTPNINSWYSRLFFFINGIFPSFTDSAYQSYGHINPVGIDEIKRLLLRNKLKGDISHFSGGYLPKIWINGGIKGILFHLTGFVLRIFMRGKKDVWCNIILLERTNK